MTLSPRRRAALKFFADYKFRDCLHGWVCRSSHPHAKILNINIEKAMAYPGVVDVITWKDVPGQQRLRHRFR